jgi:hypothetical protein
MKFELHAPWPIHGGATLIPTGTILTGLPPTWGGHTLPLPLPLDAWAMDDAAWAQMKQWYPYDQHRLMTGPLVKRS